MSFGEFLDAIGAKTPAPGGGATACAAGALAAAQAQMVVAFSLGKKNLAAHQGALEGAHRSLVTVREVFLELADEDGAAYAAVNELMKLPEGDERRMRELPGASDRAVQAPCAAVAACANLLRLLEELAPITNRHLASDLAIAAVLADGAARASACNVRVNLSMLAESRRGPIAAEVARELAACAERAARVQKACGS